MAFALYKTLSRCPSLTMHSINPGDVPTLTQLGLTKEAEFIPPSALLGPGRLRGGEGEALKHLRAFILDVKAAAGRQQEQQQGAAMKKELPGSGGSGPNLQGMCIGPTFSCKISPWLALGCISPRTVSISILRSWHLVQRADLCFL